MKFGSRITDGRARLTAVLGAVLASLTAHSLYAEEPQQVVVVVGAAGATEYGEEFEVWAQRWRAAADQADAVLTMIGIDEADDDRAALQATLKSLPSTAAEPVWLVLLGHGTYDGREAKFNLRGPDLSASDLASWLQPFERPVAIINCSSASAPFMEKLAGPQRVVVTATKSGHEQNYARFGDYFSAAIADPAADLDKDQQTSLLEAFITAARRVEEFYKREGRLATEHALIDDNGDQRGTPASWFRGVRAVQQAADDTPLDGLRAHQLHLVRSQRERQLSEQARQRRDELELAIETLRQSKDSMAEEDYYDQLEPIMIELARLYETAP